MKGTIYMASFIEQVLMFWVTDNFLMKKPKKSGRKRAIRYQRVRPINNNSSCNNIEEDDDTDTLLSGDEDLLDATHDEAAATSPLAFKNVEELLLNVNRRNNSVV